MNEIKFKFLREDAVKPSRATHFSAGYDLVALDEVTLESGQITTIPLGFATEMPGHLHCRIEARSGLALKGLAVITGVIDADYRGEWKVILGNLSAETQTIAAGQRVAQAVFRPTVSCTFEEVKELSQSKRGEGGFGSTGA
jgi:dUTP pyrophosphatase